MYKYLILLLFLLSVLLTNSVLAESVSGSATPLDGCAPLTVRLKAEPSDIIGGNYRWEAINGSEIKEVFGAVTEMLLKTVGDYAIKLYVDKEGSLNTSEVGTITVKAPEACQEPAPEPLDTCFKVTIGTKQFSCDEPLIANKAGNKALTITFDASSSMLEDDRSSHYNYEWQFSGDNCPASANGSPVPVLFVWLQFVCPVPVWFVWLQFVCPSSVPVLLLWLQFTCSLLIVLL